ncbi:MAG: hypothetical protein U0446_09525 [Dehalococcoidia bacterium]
MQPTHQDDSQPYHLVVGDVTGSDRAPSFRDPALGRVQVRIDGELAGHPHAHELVSGLAEQLAGHAAAGGTALHFEVDDEALRGGASVREAARLASDPFRRAEAAAVEHLQSWLSARGPVARPTGEAKAEDAE